ncbi:MAG TPA: serine/threonine-protein kinase [Thermoanaerobaculia bacterium]|nr:serine/threonine-protein kinase [Thermoanaerobaculia bacterium]
MISDRTVARLREVAQQPDLTGTPYAIVREIGRGGMSVVYEALDARLDRAVALKVLALELSSPDAAQRMREEARTIARLEHPRIVPVHDIGELSDGRVFYAMKLVRGVTLSEFARHRGVADLLRIFLRICETVAFAHAAGVVHRDIKPQNVMIGEFGEVLVMDWGVAAAMRSEGEIAGTHGFMAPEQLRGGPADQRADIFALGAILEIISGSKQLRAIAAKAKAEDVRERYATADDLAADVTRYLDGQPVTAYRENAIEWIARWIRRNLALVGIVAAYLIMRLIIFLWLHR